MKKLTALAAVVAVAALLGGCVVVPYDGYYGHGHRGRYYNDHWGRYSYDQGHRDNDRGSIPNWPDRRLDERWES